MTDESIVNLINKEIDGDILPIESQRLQERLANDPTAKELSDELHAAMRALANAKEVGPPPTLKSRVFLVIQSLEEEKSRKLLRRHALSSLWRAVRQHFTPQFAYAFAGGLATGMIVLALIFNALNMPPFDESEASGTMALTTEHFTVNLDKVHGTIVADRPYGIKSLNLKLLAQEGLTAHIDFDPKLVRIDNVKPVESPSTQLAIRDGEVEIRGTGSIECTIAFESSSEPSPQVHVSLTSGGKVIYEKDIDLDHSHR